MIKTANLDGTRILDHETWKPILTAQFTAAIDTLENAIEACPKSLWVDQTRFHQFWYIASHTLFWLDFYLSESPDTFRPPEPFGLEELDPSGVIPDPPHTKEQLLVYLDHGRRKCVETIGSMTPESARKLSRVGKMNLSRMELYLYVLRHVQHHAAQLNLILRQETNSAPGWVFRGKEQE